MKSVFVLTDGEYSDYRIVSVFTTKELAEDFKLKFGCGEIEEHILDRKITDEVPLYNENYFIYHVYYNVKENSYECKKSEWCYASNEFDDKQVEPMDGYSIRDNKYWYIGCYAKDEKHALKIANERIKIRKIKDKKIIAPN